MKTLIISQFRRFALVALLSLPFAVQAENHFFNPEKPKSFEMALYRISNTSKVSLALVRHVEEPMTIRLVDERGKVLYRETLSKKQQQYKRNFNLKDVENGTYYFEFKSGEETFRKRLELSTPTQQLIAIK
ncbi:hypothetical protein GCM10027275_36220 [Rhabdobacter roseus]|uniref:Secretion system C-terminal sorting domain-containing protein n=1 Tax=Rhabdobacter roseus TaxID=1655419 RepID=A0A840TQ74_9BACT|nr:hypothetical protein [Rhabdobacter roseus]MBB5285971.1 hypothetical protein [Rhabdobacter roseus]